MEHQEKILRELIEKHAKSGRDFSRNIQEDYGDVSRWLNGRRITVRAVITINKMFGIEAEVLRPDLFKGVKLVFKDKK
jgi:antitoxin component HigA of HigAB toxin-antitoxin module